MNEIQTNKTVNIQLVESLVQAIRSLSPAEQALLEEKLFGEIPNPSTLELMHLADKGRAFDSWHDEPDLYTIEDGEPICAITSQNVSEGEIPDFSKKSGI